MQLAKRILLCVLILTLIILACTRLENNNSYYSHIQDFDNLYEQSSDNPYPIQNFLYVDKVLMATDKKGEQSGQPISSASAIAVHNYGEKVYAFTAGHWCEEDVEEYSSMLTMAKIVNPEVNFSIENRVAFYGEFYPIQDVFIDSAADLCVVTFDSPFAHRIKKIKPAKKYPKIGEKVYTSSAPLGMFSHQMRFLFDGYFSGCSNGEIYCFYTVPGVQGSSGSGVLNKKGQLISILDVSVVNFHNITGGARLENIIEMYHTYIR